MKSTIGQVLIINGGAVLKDVSENTYVRYSHSSVAAPDDVGPAKVASDNFESACEQVSVDLIINPGDICVINNRISLHGRGEVGDDCGGDSRWILRSYALDTSSLGAEKRHNQHVLYP